MRILSTVLFAALVLASASVAGSTDFKLQKVAQTDKTVTFAWKRQPGADGYRFLRNGVVVSRTFDRSTTTATFWKGSRYTVEVLRVTVGGRVVFDKRASVTAIRTTRTSKRQSMKLVFVAAPKVEFKLRLASRTPKTITFAWKPQPGADGYAFVRNGVVVSRTFDRSTTTATFWKGSRYAVHELRRTPDRKVVSVRHAAVYAKALRRGSKKIRLVFVPARRVDFALRLADRTSKTVTFTWKRQPDADGYQFVRNGVVVSRTFNRSTTAATFWKGSRYAVDVLRRTGSHSAIPVTRALAYSISTTASGSAKQGDSGAGLGANQPQRPPTLAPGSSAAPGPSAPSNPPQSSSPPPSTSTPSPTQPKPTPTPPPPPPPKPTPPPPPPTPPSVGPGGIVTLTGSQSPAAFFAAVALAPPGPVTVTGGYTVTGDIQLTRPSLRIDNAAVDGIVEFRPGANGSSMTNSSAMGFDIFGADNVLISGNSFDGRGIDNQNVIWDEPAGNTPDAWRIANNSFRNFYRDDGSHSEALFVGYSTNGLIENNTFTNNGNTSHVFFSWWGATADPATSYPRNICVRGNTFNETHGAYFDVNFRDEIPASANIVIQRDATNTSDEFYGDC